MGDYAKPQNIAVIAPNNQPDIQLESPSGIESPYDNRHLHRWIWFITGPTACGKTTIAKALAEDLDFTFLEGDDVSPPYYIHPPTAPQSL